MTSNGKSSISGDVMRMMQKLTKRRSAPAAMSNRIAPSTKATGNSHSKLEVAVDPRIERLQQLCAQFHFACAECKAPLEIDIEAQFESWHTGAQNIPPKAQLSSMRCSQQSDHLTCAGCGKAPTFGEKNIFTPLGVINQCCDKGRLFGIWFLLSRYDEAQLLQPTQASKKDGTKKLVKHPKSVSTPGVGYAAGYNDYMDIDGMDGPWGPYTGAEGPWSRAFQPLDSDHEQNMKAQDTLIIETLKLLTQFLPSPSAEATAELDMLRLSFFFDRIAELIRNDSITDITERKLLFSEVITFAQAIADRPSLRDLLYTGRSVKVNSPGLRHLGIAKLPSSFVLDDSPNNQASSFFTNSIDTYRQAKTFLQLADKQKSRPGFNDDISSSQGKEVTLICQSLVDLYESLEKLLAGSAGVPSQNIVLEDPWAKFQEEHRVTFTDDILKNHRYHREILALSSATKKGRTNTISKEVATMTTSLPTGIFLKVAESRSDVMKVLIVGSEGSPYAGGLFIFDLFLDAEYPTTPPKMSFVLNGNDSEAHSFNPNLHRGGGVCLSILNTWSGAAAERWQPNRSTILAVLISIQAMILGAPIPWINEPGYELQKDTKPAQDHRLLMQTKTLKYAMIAWLENDFKNPMATEYVWKDISQAYFKKNSMKVMSTIREWAKENPSLANYDAANPIPKKSRKKAKSKTAAAEPEPAPGPPPINMVEKLENLLGIKPEVQEEVTTSSKIGGLMNRLKGKRKASDSEGALNIPHHLKKQKSESPSMVSKWVYTGGKSQKEVRAVCKEFGIGSKPTIKDSIAKLEAHVNEKGKASPTLVEKWGKIMAVEGGDDMTTGSGTDSGIASGSASAWGV